MTRARKVLQSPWLPFLVFYLLFAVLHAGFSTQSGDDAFYSNVMHGFAEWRNAWDMVAKHYQMWSARQITEFTACMVGGLSPWVWRLLNPLMAVFCAFGTSYLLHLERDVRANALVCVLYFIHQWPYMADAGWVITTVIYFWTAALGILALLLAARTLRGNRVPVWAGIAACLATVFAANGEQTALMLTALLLLYAGVGIRRHRLPWFVPVQLVICAASFVYMFTCPGSAARMEGEMISYYKNYSMVTFFQKVEIGVSFAMRNVIFTRNFVFFFLCLLVCTAVFLRYKSILFRMMAVWPLLVALFGGMLHREVLGLFPQLSFWLEAFSPNGTVTLASSGNPLSFLPLLLLYATFCVFVVDVYLALGHTADTLLALYFFLCGAATNAAIAFTSAIGVSGERTALIFSFSLIGVCMILYRSLREEKRVGLPAKGVFSALLCAACIYQTYSLWEMWI